jgi:hypothetical protein
MFVPYIRLYPLTQLKHDIFPLQFLQGEMQAIHIGLLELSNPEYSVKGQLIEQLLFNR